MSAAEFGSVLTEKATGFLNTGGEVVVPLCETPVGEIPVGVISIAYNEHRAYPHAVWFPEATPRLRLEVIVKFLVELKKKNLVLITSEEKDLRFFRHLCRYGLLKSVGKIFGYGGDNVDVMLFQSVGH